jgi:hypothetical protein
MGIVTVSADCNGNVETALHIRTIQIFFARLSSSFPCAFKGPWLRRSRAHETFVALVWRREILALHARVRRLNNRTRVALVYSAPWRVWAACRLRRRDSGLSAPDPARRPICSRSHDGLSSTRVRVLVQGLALASLKHNVSGLVFVRSCSST